MKSAIISLMILTMAAAPTLNAFPEWVAGTNVQKLIAVDNAIISNERTRAAALSNQLVLRGQIVTVWSNSYQKEKTKNLPLQIKATVWEIVAIAITVYFTGRAVFPK